MPRTARLDVTGILQHVIVRGIEKRDIFLDDGDRRSFLARFSNLLQETGVDCLAWAVMANHVHLLLRPRRTKLALFMRRLLTGYAVNFNLRHRRSGHLFQNRYKSIVCEEEPYLLELVRYIHLNPVRAGLVEGMNELDEYEWSGHSVLMGKQELAGQRTAEILRYFGRRLKGARRRYRDYVAEGISRGRRDELVGGGLRRSLKLAGAGGMQEYDERILGSGEFVEELKKVEGLADRLPSAMPVKEVIEKMAAFFSIGVDDLRKRVKEKRVVEARNMISYFAVRELGHNGAEVAKLLNVTRSAVSIAAGRGEQIIRNRHSLLPQIKRILTI
jgi:putative transposase